MNENRRPILYNGEVYSKPIEKKSGGGGKEPEISYEFAREKLLKDLSYSTEILKSMPSTSRLPNEVVLCFRMLPQFSAKSYYPDTLFDQKIGINEIGSRTWTNSNKQLESKSSQESSPTSGKLFFVRASNKSLDAFEQQLNRKSSTLTKKFTLDVRRVSSLDLLNPSEQILGVNEDWSEGCLEAVLHPFAIDKELSIRHFLSLLVDTGTNRNNIKIKQYGEGVTFFSFVGNRETLKIVAGYNPLRTVHPLTMRPISISRGTTMLGGPSIPDFTRKPSIVVGVIDGGAADNPYLNNYIERIDSTIGLEDSNYVSHGSQVTGAVLYGALNSYGNTDKLPEPQVSVRSFRVLSQSTSDPDLYDVIDSIENIVPNNLDINVYNLSIGPVGPILDDSISRFTFSCDMLSRQHNILFCVAVGNDGDKPGYDRIQSPSDMVNGLAVGAYSKKTAQYERAFYSCIGPGREGNKMKPDLLAFGGCDQHPIHLIGPSVGEKIWNLGTSFASPIVAGFAGKLIGSTNNVIDALTSRAMLIHSVTEKNGLGHSFEIGHGILTDDFNDLISCPTKGYTLIFKGELESTKYAEYNIPWTRNIIEGSVNVRWTTAVLTDVDQNSPDDYTSSSVVTAFYPNKNKYVFKKGSQTKVIDISNQKGEALRLKNEGWSQSTFPKTDSGKPQYKNEEDLRQQELKWDTMDTRQLSKLAKSIENPVFHVHALGRGSNNLTKVKFVIILTVEAPKAKVDLYQKILVEYKSLIPLTVNIDIPLKISV